ncbi:hypothetical protein [Rheinheimera riviphila]|uniref:hypothetical protein n=1 Tax=Rheinheimera riviphila TaxID=1834037 RepID=UPI0013E3C7C4|nr:hypothetical protein [Rheinheimera riviphila]
MRFRFLYRSFWKKRLFGGISELLQDVIDIHGGPMIVKKRIAKLQLSLSTLQVIRSRKSRQQP